MTTSALASRDKIPLRPYPSREWPFPKELTSAQWVRFKNISGQLLSSSSDCLIGDNRYDPARREIQQEGLLTESAASRFLCISSRTLQTWRAKGKGPPFVRVGRAIRYFLHSRPSPSPSPPLSPPLPPPPPSPPPSPSCLQTPPPPRPSPLSPSLSPAANHLQLETWSLSRLVPSARNARTHSPAQVAEIAGSIRAFGFSNPILVGEDGDIIAGHGRLSAARLLGFTEVPVIVLSGLSEVQRRQLVLADNRIALNAGWDLKMLSMELKDLSVIGADLAALGFTTQELARALMHDPVAGLTNEDEIPELGETAISRMGDIWCAGAHRVACGDSTNATSVAALFAGAAPHLMVTDPPYGVKYDPSWRHRTGANRSARRAKILNDDQADWSAAWRLFPGNIAYVWHGAPAHHHRRR